MLINLSWKRTTNNVSKLVTFTLRQVSHKLLISYVIQLTQYSNGNCITYKHFTFFDYTPCLYVWAYEMFFADEIIKLMYLGWFNYLRMCMFGTFLYCNEYFDEYYGISVLRNYLIIFFGVSMYWAFFFTFQLFF